MCEMFPKHPYKIDFILSDHRIIVIYSRPTNFNIDVETIKKISRAHPSPFQPSPAEESSRAQTSQVCSSRALPSPALAQSITGTLSQAYKLAPMVSLTQ